MLISPDKLNNLCITAETVTNHCYVNRQIIVSLFSTNIKLLSTSFDLLTDAISDWPTADHVRQLYFVAALVYSGLWDFLYGRYNQLFSELNNAFFPDIYLKQYLSG